MKGGHSMKHRFRKYISKRGSALFMVLSVMTSLIVTCMAMYFSVVSSRRTQYAIFNQQQSYQSALSLNESLLGAIYMGLDGSTNGEGFKELQKQMFKLQKGEKLTTSGNGFSAFGVGTKEDEDQVGAYTAEITMLGSVSGGNLYDIAVTAMINGTQSIVRQQVVLGSEEEPPISSNPKLPLFTSSGLVPTSSSIGMGAMYSDTFYDAEYTYLMPYGEQHGTNAQMNILGNLYAAGTLNVNYNIASTYRQWEFNVKPHEWYIRKDLIMSNEKCSVSFPPESIIHNSYTDKTNRVVVLGDCTFKADSMGFANCDIYVCGNLTFETGAKMGTNVRIFVAGSVTGSPYKTNPADTDVKFYEGESSWGSAGGKILSKGDCREAVGSSTNSVRYFDWNSVYGDKDGNAITFTSKQLNIGWWNAEELKWTSNSKGYEITGVNFTSGVEGQYDNGDGFKVIIDTGNNIENVLTIRLKGYLDGGKTFSWSPNYGDWPVWVIVKGKGSVVFEVPNGVNYENRSYKTTIMHEGWLDPFQAQNMRGQVGETFMKSKFIHHGCGDTCCVNEMKPIEGATCKNKDATGNECGEQLYNIVCPTHELDTTYCKKCDANQYKWELKPDGKEYSYGTCEYRINPKGSGITPTVNIFLVMCGTESKLMFTPDKQKCDVNGINESLSSFWGYIYAPYTRLEYSAGLSGGDRIQFVGGIAVAEFNINEYHPFVAAYPTKTPDQLMPDKCKEHELMSIDGMPWKENLSNGNASA